MSTGANARNGGVVPVSVANGVDGRNGVPAKSNLGSQVERPREPANAPTHSQRLAKAGANVAEGGLRVGMVVGIMLALLLMLGSMLLAWFGVRRASYVEARSQIARAKIIDVQTGDDAVFKNATYEFSVGTTAYKRTLLMRDPILASTLDIEYDPSNPNDSAVDANPQNQAIYLIGAGVVVFLTAIACLVLSQNAFGQALFASIFAFSLIPD